MKGKQTAKSPIILESPVDGRTVLLDTKGSPSGFKEFLTGVSTKKDPIAVVPTQPGRFTPFSTKVDPKLTEYVNTMDGKAPPPQPRSASIVQPKAQPTQAVPPTQAPTQESGSFLSNLFSGSKVEPGEYSTGRNVGEGVIQFLGNFGNNISGNAQSNIALNQAFAKARQDYMDKDPNSRSSVLYRGMAQRMGLPIRGDETAYNLKEQMPNVKEFLQSRDLDLRERMASMRGQGGTKQPANQGNAVKDINDHLASLRDLSAMGGNIAKLNRNPLGSFLPDTNADTIATAAEIEKQVQSGVKAIAGPGSIQESERERFMPLLPNSKERSGVASAKQQSSMRTAIDKGKNYIKDQLNMGTINEDTARYLMNEYAKYDAQLNRGKK